MTFAILPRLCLLAIVATLSACGGGGGGGSSAPTQAPGAAPVIRFEVNYQPNTTYPGVTAAGRYLTIRALPGDTSLGTRATASVQLVFDQEAARTLATPTYVDAQGRANYVFPISDSYAATLQYRNCTAWFAAHVTVTDLAGLSFAKDLTVCPIQAESVGAFSDYGDHTATFSAAGPPGITRADFNHGNTAGPLDATTSTTASGTSTWSVRAADGDRLWARVSVPPSTTPGLVLSARVDLQGGEFAETAALSDLGVTSGLVTCCAPAPDPSAPLQTVTFTVSASVYNVAWTTTPPANPVDLRYRVVDGVTGQTRAEFSGTPALSEFGYGQWSFQARAGDTMFIQASTSAANSGVTVTAPGGSAASFAPGVPARLNVIVPRSP